MSEVEDYTDPDFAVRADLWPVPGRPGFYRAGPNGNPISGALVPGSMEQSDLLGYIRNGAHIETACDLCGVDKAQLGQWRSLGSKHLEWLAGGSQGPHPPARGRSESFLGLCAYFVLELRKAEAACEVTHVQNWSDAGLRGDWRASRDFLARHWPERWREQREQVTSTTQALDGPAPNATTPDLAAIIAALVEAGVTSKDLAIEATATEVEPPERGNELPDNGRYSS